jgi:Ca2+-binding EF-hand superfamily protein
MMTAMKTPSVAMAAMALLVMVSAVSADPPAGRPAEPAKPAGEMTAADWLEKAFAGRQPPEAVRMLIAICRGSQMGPGDGWFGPAQTRYTWDWLVRLHGKDAAEGITKEQFRGPEKWFARLDRNKDGRITAEDLDWSDNSPYLRQLAQARQLARAIDRDSNGKISQEEWEAFFKKMAKDKGYVTPDDLRDALFPPPPPRQAGKEPMGPSAATLLKGLLSGELGSVFPGPNVGQQAPDFMLKTADGKQTYSLWQLRGNKPIVLVFGSFT